MDAARLGAMRIFNWLARPGGAAMQSRLRNRLHDPARLLEGSGLQAGQTVLEVGCGPGYFTLSAARMIGDGGRLIAMDPLANFVETVERKVRDADLTNVEVVRRDALETQLESGSVDLVLLFGAVPFPTLPLSRLLPETRRVLKDDGSLALWLFPAPVGVPRAIWPTVRFFSGSRQVSRTQSLNAAIAGPHQIW